MQRADVDLGVGEAHRRRPAELVDDRRRCAVGDDPAAVHHDDAIAQPLGLLDVVGDEHHRRAAVADAADHVPGVPPADGIEVLGQLVEEHELGPADEGEGDEQALALAAGQGAERASPEAGEVPLLGELAERTGARVQRREQPQRLADTQLVRQGGVLQLGADAPAQAVAGRRRVEAEHARRPAVGPAQALEDLDRRRLAGSVRAEQAEQLAAPDGEGHVAEDLGRSVALAQPVDFHKVVRHASIVRLRTARAHRPTVPSTPPPSRGWPLRSGGQRCGSTSPWSKANTIAAARSRTPSLVKMAPTWVFTVASLTNSSPAISPLVAPRAISRSTSCSRSVSSSILAASARRGRTLLRNAVSTRGVTLGSSHAAPPATARAAAMRSSAAGVLEDEPGGTGVEGAPQGVVVVERRQHEHRRAGSAVGERPGRRHAVHPAHPHVHQDEVGAVLGDRLGDLVAVAALGDDLEAVVGSEDAGDAAAHDRLVVDDDDADHDRSELAARRGEDRQAGIDPPAVDRRPGIEVAAEGTGPLAHPDQPEVTAVRVRRRRRLARDRRP